MNYDLMLNIRGEELRAIVDREKKVEYRDIKPFYDVRMAKCKPPFLLRLINGMRAEAPEIVVEVVKVRKDKRKSKNRKHGVYCLYIGDVMSKKNLRNLVK